MSVAKVQQVKLSTGRNNGDSFPLAEVMGTVCEIGKSDSACNEKLSIHIVERLHSFKFCLSLPFKDTEIPTDKCEDFPLFSIIRK